LGNNCQTFVEALLAFVLEGQEEEGDEDDEEDDSAGPGSSGDDVNDEDLDEAASVLSWILGDDE
jgi:hypothetical protein